MGFNTVAFILNDFVHELADNPHTTAYMVGNPYNGSEEPYMQKQAASVAVANGERVPHSQALRVLPSFHASGRKFFMAGGNCIVECEVIRYRKRNGKKTVTLELPDWASRWRI